MDVAVVGGSVAGLQAALTLGRARLRVVLFDDGSPRNLAASHVHNYLGVPSASPAELLAVGLQQLREYDVEVRQLRVDGVVRSGGGFVVDGVEVRAVVLATGLRDELPDVPGLAERWGRTVVACPHCHGWEVRDQPLVQLGLRDDPERSVARALLLSRWSNQVTLCTGGPQPDLTQLTRAGVTVRTEPVLKVTAGPRIHLSNGDELNPRMVFATVRQSQQSDLAERLGCAASNGAVVTDPAGRTTIPGIYAAGTTTHPALLAIAAAGHASTVAVTVHSDLLESELGGGR
ncbi:NAD(P)/FAD-dependent oxidoreductase [Kribbella sp. NPDC026611]|uniref:NAD(P)/FAD-dependent oxidoreductase n=1 Tax=Kribbella sp. NPDC026611 TaxID=3154911 RepID=UPI003404B685